MLIQGVNIYKYWENLG